jgi:phospholipid-binding lipoprotein MlaA
MHNFVRILSLAALALMGACAAVPTDPVERAAFNANNDPLEPLNRKIFSFNQSVDKAVIKPVAVAYRDTVPVFVQNRIFNIAGNLGEPVVFVNNVLQARVGSAAKTLVRFSANSTIGLAGMFDVMGPEFEKQTGDFGQTLYAWGIHDDGPYLMLPLFGPSNLRDGLGMGVDQVINPVGLATRGSMTRSVLTAMDHKDFLDNGNAQFQYATLGITILSVIDLRARYLDAYDELERGSLDFYAKLRSVNRQRRNADLGRAPGQTTLIDPGLVDPGN